MSKTPPTYDSGRLCSVFASVTLTTCVASTFYSFEHNYSR